MTGLQRKLIVTGGAVIVLLTACAFWLSYSHLHRVADGNGLNGAEAWAWPATLDLFIIAGEILMLVAALAGRRDPWAIALTVAGSVGSIGLNVAGVGLHQPALHYVVAAVPPTAALLAFGALMRQVHVLVRNAETPGQTARVAAEDGPVAVAPEPVAPAVAPVADPLEELFPDGPIVAADVADEPSATGTAAQWDAKMRGVVAEQFPEWDVEQSTLQVVRADRAERPTVTARVAEPRLLSVAEVAEELGVSPSTVRSWVHRGKLSPAAREGGLLFDQAALEVAR